jgi:hypothetical protein
MPIWKQPFWYWIKWFKAWPFSVEALSGLFDFNHAPFLQSFMEVRVDGPEVGWFSSSTASTAPSAGATCRSAARFSRRRHHSMIRWNSSCRWTSARAVRHIWPLLDSLQQQAACDTAAQVEHRNEPKRHRGDRLWCAAQTSCSTICMTPPSGFLLRLDPLLSETLSIRTFSGRTQQIP